jgi:hypothetical protein
MARTGWPVCAEVGAGVTESKAVDVAALLLLSTSTTELPFSAGSVTFIAASVLADCRCMMTRSESELSLAPRVNALALREKVRVALVDAGVSRCLLCRAVVERNQHSVHPRGLVDDAIVWRRGDPEHLPDAQDRHRVDGYPQHAHSC